MELERVTTVPSLPPRSADAHKGDFGRVLVVGGSGGMIGAVALAANAALRGGAGLVTFAAPRTIQPTVAGLSPAATSIPLACDADGQLSPEAVGQIASAAASADVLAVGPGMAVGETQAAIVAAVLEIDRPTVLDADGLNNLTAVADWPARRRGPLVLTPHPGEFGRLTGRPAGEIQDDRAGAAVAAAGQWSGGSAAGQLVCVLKGAGTVVTDGGRVYVNDTGNPGMATGGTGDVLTGLVAALIGQGLSPFDAACLGVWVHGRAGDLAAETFGQASLTAVDVLDCVAPALCERSA